MSCKHSDSCPYYRTYRDRSDSRQHQLLIHSYCEGRLQHNCRRREYESLYAKSAPEELAPNGYLLGTHKKVRIECTRKHKRHQVDNCVCLLQVVDTKKTFSAKMFDISEGGVQLKLNAQVEDIELCPKSNQLKILGYSTEKLPVSPTEDILKVAWQKEQSLGCFFVAETP